MRGRLCGGAEHDVFTSVDLIHRGHSLESGSDLRLPQHLAGRGVQSSDLPVTRYPPAVTMGPTLGKCEPVFLIPFAANSGTSPRGTCHLMVPWLRS